MLLQQLAATNSRGVVLDLPLGDNSSGFSVKEVRGLDPVKANIVSSSFANMDGEQYHSSRREARNIIVTLGLDPNLAEQDVESLRRELYNYFMPKSATSLTFSMYDRFATNILLQKLALFIDGRIESFEAPLFEQNPEATLSIMCFNPDFVDPRVVEFDGSSVADLTETTLAYDGTVDTGIVFSIMPDRALTAFSIYHRPADQTLRSVDVQYPLAAGDILTVSSVRGDKYARLLSGGVETSVLYAVSPQSAWLELQPGDNDLRIYADGAPVPYKITYTNKYGGL